MEQEERDREEEKGTKVRPREGIGTKKPRELVAKMTELYWNQKLSERKQSPGPELKRFRVGCKVTSARRSHGY